MDRAQTRPASCYASSVVAREGRGAGGVAEADGGGPPVAPLIGPRLASVATVDAASTDASIAWLPGGVAGARPPAPRGSCMRPRAAEKIGRASCRERGWGAG